MNKKYTLLCDLLETAMVSAGITGYETLNGSGKNFFQSYGKDVKKKKAVSSKPIKKTVKIEK